MFLFFLCVRSRPCACTPLYLHRTLRYSRGRPDSMKMKCLYEIGRDSWDRDGQRSVDCPEKKSPPEEGDETVYRMKP